MLLAVLKNLGMSVLSPNASMAVTRSAIFLLTFSVMHCAGNMFMFFGPDAFNGYGYFLMSNPAIKFIEAYLGLGLILHAVVALYLSYKKWKTIAKQPMGAWDDCAAT